MENILEIIKEEKNGNNIYKLNPSTLNKKVKELKKQVINGNFKFNDSIMNLGLIGRELLKDKEEVWRELGKYILKQLEYKEEK